MADLPIDIDFEPDVLIRRKNALTRAIEPATGLTGVTLRIALTPAGAAVGGCTVAAAEAGTTGRYFGVIDTAQLVTDLAAYESNTVYLIAAKTGDFDRVYGEYIVRRSSAM